MQRQVPPTVVERMLEIGVCTVEPAPAFVALFTGYKEDVVVSAALITDAVANPHT